MTGFLISLHLIKWNQCRIAFSNFQLLYRHIYRLFTQTRVCNCIFPLSSLPSLRSAAASAPHASPTASSHDEYGVNTRTVVPVINPTLIALRLSHMRFSFTAPRRLIILVLSFQTQLHGRETEEGRGYGNRCRRPTQTTFNRFSQTFSIYTWGGNREGWSSGSGIACCASAKEFHFWIRVSQGRNRFCDAWVCESNSMS